MDALIRTHDWSASPLGTQKQWPDRLVALVEVLLASKSPMFLLWGPERTLIYNDAYISILGQKHPWALGRGMFEVWSEVRKQVEPIVDQAYAGRSSYFEDLPVVLHRRQQPEQTSFTFSYTPVRARSGEVAGTLCTLQETTRKVEAEHRLEFLIRLTDRLRRLTDPLDVFCEAAETLGQHLGVSRVGYGDVDQTARYFTTPRNWTDGTVEHHTGTHDLAAFGPEIHAALQQGEPLVVHDVSRDPRTSTPGSRSAFAYLKTAAAVTVSLIKGGRMVAALYVHSRLVRSWTDAEVRLIQDVAERTWDAVERARAEAGDARLAAIVSSSPDAIVSFSAEDKRILTWNRGAEALFGYTVGEAIGGPVSLLVSPEHLTDAENETGVFDRAMAEGQVHLDTIRRRKDGSLVPVSVSATRMIDAAGRVLGVSAIFRDITDRKRWEEHQRLLINELNHRVKNTLATVQSLTSQTLRNADTPEEARRAVEERLFALSRAHNILTDENWGGANLSDIVAQAMAPYWQGGERRLHISGRDVRLSPETALAVAMALQELATNAVKYGALSNETGKIEINWSVEPDADGQRLRLNWTESGGPLVKVPVRRGFGTRLIERSLSQDLRGEVRLAFAPTGLICTIDALVQNS